MLRMLFLLLFTVACSAGAQACDCAGPAAPEKAFEEAKAVYTAHTVALQKNQHGFAEKVELTVDKTWKGAPGKSITVDSLRRGCAFMGFEDNTQYIIYQQPSWDKQAPDDVNISSCSRTKKLADGQIESRYLDAIAAGKETAAIDASLPAELTGAEDPKVRAEAAALLGWMTWNAEKRLPADAAAALIKAVSDKEPAVRIAAARSLSHRSLAVKPEAKQALLQMLTSDNVDVRDAAASGLSMAGRDAVSHKALVEALAGARKNPNADKKRQEGTIYAFARALAETQATLEQQAETVTLLTAMVDEVSDPYNRVGVIQHLGFQKEKARQAVPKLLEVLKTVDNDHLRQYTIHALGDIGAAEAQPAIAPYLNDKSCYVSSAVITAESKIDPAGFGAFLKQKAMPVLETRFDACAAEYSWGFQAVGKPAAPLEPFLAKKHAAMDNADWKKATLKNVLDMLRAQKK
ncbi:MAG: HEAT repeat domain-containing protein [Alphaproteobacteria bacterium]